MLTAIVTTTAINIMKSKKTEQKSPELLTVTAAPRSIALRINHGRGSLQRTRLLLSITVYMIAQLVQKNQLIIVCNDGDDELR